MDHQHTQNSMKRGLQKTALYIGVYVLLVHPVIYTAAYFGTKKGYESGNQQLGDLCSYIGYTGPANDMFSLHKARYYYAESQNSSVASENLETAISAYEWALIDRQTIAKHDGQDVLNAFFAIIQYAETIQDQTPQRLITAAAHYKSLLLNHLQQSDPANYRQAAADIFVMMGKLHYLRGDTHEGLESFSQAIILKGKLAYEESKIPASTSFEKLMKDQWLHHLSQQLKTYCGLYDELFVRTVFRGTTAGILRRGHRAFSIETKHREALNSTVEQVLNQYRQISQQGNKK